jgi:lipoprotein-releasing system permease protein
MRYPALSIAARYLFSPKSTRVVNLISGITALAMAVGTAALIIVMSVFNGFESLIKSLYQVFYTDLVIVPTEGKFFSPDADLETLLRTTPGIVAYTSVLEENVLTEYNGRQYIATLKGVDDRYYDVVDELEDYIVDGSSKLEFEGTPLTLMGAGVAYTLGISPSAPNNYLTLYMPRGDKTSISDVANAFRIESILPGGIFMVQQDFDSKFLITPIAFARQLMAEPEKISAIEIKLKNARQAEDIQAQLQQKIPASLKVKTRYQQNETLYRVMRTEKWVVFAILSFIVLIAAFNVVGSLSMLVIEKRRDIATLKALGADTSQIRRIFLLEGDADVAPGCRHRAAVWVTGVRCSDILWRCHHARQYFFGTILSCRAALGRLPAGRRNHFFHQRPDGLAARTQSGTRYRRCCAWSVVDVSC